MRGFLVGSLALIVLYVAVQPGSAAKAQTGSNVLVSTLRRALSPQVAGLPDRGRTTATWHNPPSQGGGGGGGKFSPTITTPAQPGTIPV